MFRLEENIFINLDHVESLKIEASVFMVRMISGEQFIISPSNFNEILKIKKYQDSTISQFAG